MIRFAVWLAFGAFACAQPVSRLVFGSYLGWPTSPSGVDQAPSNYLVATDGSGATITAATVRQLRANNSMTFDVLLAKVSADGRTLWSGTLPNAVGIGMAVDGTGYMYLCGMAYGSFQPTAGALSRDGGGFVAKLDWTGKPVWATRLKATPYAVAVDSSGAVYLTGVAAEGFPATPGAAKPVVGKAACNADKYGTGRIPCTDAFVAKISGDGTRLIYASFLGGSENETGYGIAVDSAGSAYVAGETYSADFPVSPGAYQTKFGGAVGFNAGVGAFVGVGGDGFVVRVSPDGSQFLYSTYFGGSDADFASGIAVDPTGTAYVVGTTRSRDFPVTANAFQPSFGGTQSTLPVRSGDVFFAKLEAGGKVSYTSYYGAAEDETGSSPALDGKGRLYFLKGQRLTNECQAATEIAVADTASGHIVDRQGVLNLVPGNDTLAIDPKGIVHVLGAAVRDTDPFGVTQKPVSVGGPLLARVDFTKPDVFVPACVTNAASYATHLQFGAAALSIAPGEVFSIFGRGFGTSPRVRIGGLDVRILYASDTQINAELVPTFPVGPSSLEIVSTDGKWASYDVSIPPVFPGIFTVDGVFAAVVNQDGTVNSAEHPAPRASIVSVYATGLGAVRVGDLANRYQLYINAPVEFSAEGMEILWAGLAPGPVFGLYQVNARIPSNASTGQPQIRFVFDAPIFESSQEGVRIHVSP